MSDMDTGRTWSNAPSGVRDARALAWLGMIFSGLLLPVAIWLLASARDLVLPSFLTVFVPALYFPIYIWLLSGLKRGVKAAYYVQLVIAIIGLLSLPIGTLVNGYILFKWFRPETRAWFGV